MSSQHQTPSSANVTKNTKSKVKKKLCAYISTIRDSNKYAKIDSTLNTLFQKCDMSHFDTFNDFVDEVQSIPKIPGELKKKIHKKFDGKDIQSSIFESPNIIKDSKTPQSSKKKKTRKSLKESAEHSVLGKRKRNSRNIESTILDDNAFDFDSTLQNPPKKRKTDISNSSNKKSKNLIDDEDIDVFDQSSDDGGDYINDDDEDEVDLFDDHSLVKSKKKKAKKSKRKSKGKGKRKTKKKKLKSKEKVKKQKKLKPIVVNEEISEQLPTSQISDTTNVTDVIMEDLPVNNIIPNIKSTPKPTPGIIPQNVNMNMNMNGQGNGNKKHRQVDHDVFMRDTNNNFNIRGSKPNIMNMNINPNMNLIRRRSKNQIPNVNTTTTTTTTSKTSTKMNMNVMNGNTSLLGGSIFSLSQTSESLAFWSFASMDTIAKRLKQCQTNINSIPSRVFAKSIISPMNGTEGAFASQLQSNSRLNISPLKLLFQKAVYEVLRDALLLIRNEDLTNVGKTIQEDHLEEVLMDSLANNEFEISEVLIKLGAKLTIHEIKGNIQFELVDKMIIQCRLQEYVDDKDVNGKSLLYRATECSNVDLIRLLMKKYSCREALQDNKGMSPRCIALKRDIELGRSNLMLVYFECMDYRQEQLKEQLRRSTLRLNTIPIIQ